MQWLLEENKEEVERYVYEMITIILNGLKTCRAPE
jgi:hypothetical protein